MGLIGDAAFSSSPMSGQGTGLALVCAYLLAGELASAGWDAEAGSPEIGRLHAHSRAVPLPDAEPSPEPDMDALMALVGRALNGIELPGYRGGKSEL